MPMQRANFPKSLEAGLNAVWMSNERNFPEEWPRLFERKKSNKAVEEQVLRAGLGAGQIKAEGTTIAEDMGGESWTQRYLNITVALMFSLTQEALEDNLYMDLGRQYTIDLQRAMKETKGDHGGERVQQWVQHELSNR